MAGSKKISELNRITGMTTGTTGTAMAALLPIVYDQTTYSISLSDVVRYATGYTGSRGYTGSQGVQGVTGYTGSIGYTGSQGSQGVQGPIGYTGSASTVAGPQGVQGPIGYTGSQGSQGVQGPIGYTGPQGPIGYTGSAPTSFPWNNISNKPFNWQDGNAIGLGLKPNWIWGSNDGVNYYVWQPSDIIGSTVADQTSQGIGTYVFAARTYYNSSEVTIGSVYPGSQLIPAGIFSGQNLVNNDLADGTQTGLSTGAGTLPGTWKAAGSVGYAAGYAITGTRATLFVRVA